MEAMRNTRSCMAANGKSIRRDAYLVRNRQQHGSMLVEVLISVLIFSMGVLALVGLQGVSVKYASDAKYRSDASFLASQTIGQMWVDYASIPLYGNGISPPAAYPATDGTTPASIVLPGGTRTVDVAAIPAPAGGYRVTVTVGWVTPGEAASPHQFVTVTQLHN